MILIHFESLTWKIGGSLGSPKMLVRADGEELEWIKTQFPKLRVRPELHQSYYFKGKSAKEIFQFLVSKRGE